MDKRNGLATPGAGLGGKFFSLLIILLLVSSCSPPNQSAEELRREIRELKQEVKALGEKLEKLQAGQQALLEIVKQPAARPEAAAPPQPPSLPAPSQPLTVSQLLAGKDQYLGTRVTVKGEVGPVLVHHKSLLLKAPEGMVEVLFGKLPDTKLVQRLSTIPIEQPVTVTGVVVQPSRNGAAKLQLNAEAIDF